MTVSFKIDQSLRNVGSLSTGGNRQLSKPELQNDEDFIRISTAGTKEPSASELENFNKKQAVFGDRQDLSNVKNTISFLKTAAEDVESLARQEEILAKRATLLPEHTDLHTSLESERSAISTEISRVQSTANSAGVSLNSGAKLSYDDAANDKHESINVASFNTNFTSPTVSVNTATSASSAYTTLQKARGSDNKLTNHIDDAENQADNIREVEKKDVTTVENESPDTTEADKHVKDLAGEIARQVGSAVDNEVETKRIIDAASSGLDPERVKSLLA